MKTKAKKSKVLPFLQHGFIEHGQTDSQTYGICPFCGYKAHKHKYTFYINHETLEWDCKSCGKQGGFQTFLNEMSLHCKRFFKGDSAIKLSKNRGLKIATFHSFNMGFNPVTGKYILPIPFVDVPSKTWDIRFYDSKSMKSTAQCTVGLFGWDEIELDVDTVWLLEGEWDKMAWYEIQAQLKFSGTIVAVPGAGTFKDDWIRFFQKKKVKVLFDNDEPGIQGAHRVYTRLKGAVDSLQFLDWTGLLKVPEGWDIRDHYLKYGIGTYAFVLDHLKERLPGFNEIENERSISVGSTGGMDMPTNAFNGPGMYYKDVYKGYSKWLKLNDHSVLDVLFGTLIANRLEGDRIWLFLVGPSGATKSELMMSFGMSPRILTTTTLNPQTLVSGVNLSGGHDPSLLAKMHLRNMIIKDFTTILSMIQPIREEIFGILRDAYDGLFEKRFGNGIYRRYSPCNFGIIAGVTYILEVMSTKHVAFGERFLRYNIELPDLLEQLDILKKACSNANLEKLMRAELQEIAKVTLDHDFETVPLINENIMKKLYNLAIWTASSRAVVERDKYYQNILYNPFTELGTRLSKQFQKLLFGVGMFRWKKIITEDEYDVIKYVARSTLPIRRERILQTMFKIEPDGNFPLDIISEKIHLPRRTTRSVCEELEAVGFLKVTGYNNQQPSFRITQRCLDLIEKSEVYHDLKPFDKKPKAIKKNGKAHLLSLSTTGAPIKILKPTKRKDGKYVVNGGQESRQKSFLKNCKRKSV